MGHGRHRRLSPLSESQVISANNDDLHGTRIIRHKGPGGPEKAKSSQAALQQQGNRLGHVALSRPESDDWAFDAQQRCLSVPVINSQEHMVARAILLAGMKRATLSWDRNTAGTETPGDRGGEGGASKLTGLPASVVVSLPSGLSTSQSMK